MQNNNLYFVREKNKDTLVIKEIEDTEAAIKQGTEIVSNVPEKVISSAKQGTRILNLQNLLARSR